MPPGVADLCDTSLTTGQYVFESRWSWAEGTVWVLAIPLVGGFFLEHIIDSSEDEADVACLHVPELPPADIVEPCLTTWVHQNNAFMQHSQKRS